MLNTMNRKIRTSSLLVVALALLACLLAGVVRAAPGPALSRHTAITGPVELTMTIEPAVARPRDTVTLDVTLVNRQVQAEWWKQIKTSGWDKYSVVPVITGSDAIVEHVLVQDPDFDDLPALSAQIESGTMQFIRDVEAFLSSH